jgi:pimeloyl-ACP methyl ester carboxylesterase
MKNQQNRWQRFKAACRIDARGWQGAGRGLHRLGWVVLVTAFVAFVFPDFSAERALGGAVLVALALGVALGGFVLTGVLRRLTPGFWWGFWLLLAAVLLLTVPVGLAVKGQAALVLAVMLSAGLSGGGLALLLARGWRWMTGITMLAGLVSLVTLASLSIMPGWQQVSAKRPEVAMPVMDLPDPGETGPFPVTTFTYGSGNDRHRSEFGPAVTLKSDAVDGSKFIEGWEGYAGWARTRYWGFDTGALPLNGRVWMPAGDGVFPVVLIVHGNHEMEDFSDAGYGYLGQHFASHGLVTISVDENFLNSSYADMLSGIDGGLEKENDARGWLLLEHLRQLSDWNRVDGNPFHHRLDLDRVVLIGHSRGGEAVATAALFNQLPVYPDDARQKFDYQFGIRGLIAIAPADGQYRPRDRETRLVDVNYLTVQGSLDGDVQSFMGTSQYSRVTFDACLDCYKSSVYVLGANHGQFNTGWGRADFGWPGRMFLNLVPIMDAELQRRLATRLFTAFLKDTLLGDSSYRDVFSAAPRAAPWLDTPVELVTDFQSASELVLVDFENDADLESGSLPGVRVQANDLTLWREIEVALKWAPRNSAAALIGWNRQGEKTMPSYSVVLDALPAAPAAIAFSLAMAQDTPLLDEAADKAGDEAEIEAAEWETPESLDFSVVVVDRQGARARVPLSLQGVLRAPVEVQTRKHAWLDHVDQSEPVFQRYTFESTLFKDIDVTNIAALVLEFDQSRSGALYIDNVSLLPAVAQDDLDAMEEPGIADQPMMHGSAEDPLPSGPLPSTDER